MVVNMEQTITFDRYTWKIDDPDGTWQDPDLFVSLSDMIASTGDINGCLSTHAAVLTHLTEVAQCLYDTVNEAWGGDSYGRISRHSAMGPSLARAEQGLRWAMMMFTEALQAARDEDAGGLREDRGFIDALMWVMVDALSVADSLMVAFTD
jgi:hypothetical protein